MIPRHSPDEVVVWSRGAATCFAELMRRATLLSRVMPERGFILNLCEGRLAFLTAFVAAAVRGSVTLLPSSRAALAIQEIKEAYPDPLTLTDESVAALLEPAASAARGVEDMRKVELSIPAGREVAIVFTSGSTGRPEGHAKSWHTLMATARLMLDRLLPDRRYNLTATVPSQHMYGLETTIMLTLAAGVAVSDRRPFFPADIRDELASIPEPRAWVTTPAHLHACVAAGIELPKLALIVSATAPLAASLARDAERLWQAPLQEIYGCSEAGSFASRRTSETERWRTYAGAWIEQRDGMSFACGAHLPANTLLQDRLELNDATDFRLLGRASDLVKVAGKRASLAELTQRLLSISGVVDGVVFVPSIDQRPAALVVAPGLDRSGILQQLAERIDTAFIPRPLLLVEALPRNEMGKLPRAALLAAIGYKADLTSGADVESET